MKSANVMEYENAVGAAANYHTDEGWGLGKPIDEQHCYDSFIEGAKWSETNSPVIKRLERALQLFNAEGYPHAEEVTEALAYLNEIRESVK